MSLPTDSKARKDVPLARGCLFYFPDALAAVAELSKKGNDKHNPGQPLHWSRSKSNDHADCILRHLIDAGPHGAAVDPEDGVLHATKIAWRALAFLQLAIEATHDAPAAPTAVPTVLGVAVGAWAEDAWRAHDGGEMPCIVGRKVDVKFADGYEVAGSAAGGWEWKWAGLPPPGRIAFWRPAK